MMKATASFIAFALLAACAAPDPTAGPPNSTQAPPAPQADLAPPPAAPPCRPAPDRLCPVDEGAADAGFAAFRQRFSAAVAARDEAALMKMVDPNVRVSFGDGGGREAFRKAWNLPSRDSRLWAELEAIVSSGGSFRGEGAERMFWAPYVYANWPESVDAFEHVAAVRSDAPVHERADGASPRVAVVSHAILRIVTPPDRDAAWVSVRTPEGREGFVRAADVRSPIGYRAGFSKRSGEWMLEALVAGD